MRVLWYVLYVQYYIQANKRVVCSTSTGIVATAHMQVGIYRTGRQRALHIDTRQWAQGGYVTRERPPWHIGINIALLYHTRPAQPHLHTSTTTQASAA